MAEIAKIKKVEKVEVEKPKRERKQKQKDLSLWEITPTPLLRALKILYALIMIPITLIAGLIEGICYGFQKGLETSLELYRKERER